MSKRLFLAKHPVTGTVHLAEQIDGGSTFVRCNYRGPDRRVREVKGEAEVTCKRCAAIAAGTIYGRQGA